MSKYIGRLMTIGIAKETVRGAGAAPVYSLPNTKLSFDDVTKQARSTGALGYLADSEEAFVVLKHGQGDIEGEVRLNSIGLLLYAMMSGYSVSGPVDSAYTHSFTITQNNQHQSLSLVINDPNHVELYKLVMLGTLDFIMALEAIVMYKGAFLSKTARDTGLTVPAVTAETKFTKKHVYVKLAANIAGLAAAAKLAIKSASLKINKNTAVDDFLGSADPADILNEKLGVAGELELNYEDETYKNLMMNGSYKAMEIGMINTDVVIGASTNPSLKFQLPKVDFNPWNPNYQNDKITTQKVTFTGNRDTANVLDIISLCQLVNTVATY